MNKYYIVLLRNIVDGYIKTVNIVPSLESYLAEVRAFVHNNPTNAIAMWSSNWEIAYKAIDFGDPDWVNDMKTISIECPSWKSKEKDGE